MARKGGGDTINRGSAPKPGKDGDAVDITGNARARGENPSPDNRERGETSRRDEAERGKKLAG